MLSIQTSNRSDSISVKHLITDHPGSTFLLLEKVKLFFIYSEILYKPVLMKLCHLISRLWEKCDTRDP